MIPASDRHKSRVWCHHCQTWHVLSIAKGTLIDSVPCPRCGIRFARNAIVGRALLIWPWERVTRV